MGTAKKKEIVGSISFEEALKRFAEKSKKNEELLKRAEKINSLISQLSKQRAKKGLTQRDLAEIVGIKQPMIARIEKSECMPRLDTFVKLAVSLDYDIKLVENRNYKPMTLFVADANYSSHSIFEEKDEIPDYGKTQSYKSPVYC